MKEKERVNPFLFGDETTFSFGKEKGVQRKARPEKKETKTNGLVEVTWHATFSFFKKERNVDEKK
jgi:hypothetical protein